MDKKSGFTLIEMMLMAALLSGMAYFSSEVILQGKRGLTGTETQASLQQTRFQLEKILLDGGGCRAMLKKYTSESISKFVRLAESPPKDQCKRGGGGRSVAGSDSFAFVTEGNDQQKEYCYDYPVSAIYYPTGSLFLTNGKAIDSNLVVSQIRLGRLQRITDPARGLAGAVNYLATVEVDGRRRNSVGSADISVAVPIQLSTLPTPSDPSGKLRDVVDCSTNAVCANLGENWEWNGTTCSPTPQSACAKLGTSWEWDGMACKPTPEAACKSIGAGFSWNALTKQCIPPELGGPRAAYFLTNPGTQTIKLPAGVTKVRVRLVGGGGGAWRKNGGHIFGGYGGELSATVALNGSTQFTATVGAGGADGKGAPGNTGADSAFQIAGVRLVAQGGRGANSLYTPGADGFIAYSPASPPGVWWSFYRAGNSSGYGTGSVGADGGHGFVSVEW
ncbi:MAG: type II secretion system protein J [Bacteriovoracia bacterium]